MEGGWAVPLAGSDCAEKAASMLAKSRHAIAFTGAGASTESGIPDFRGTQGLWKRFDPRMASRSYFLEDPLGFWRFYAERYEFIAAAEPNGAHRALASLESRGRLVGVVTQNIDGIHAKAGSRAVLEVHGNIAASRCDRCGAGRATLDLIRGPVARGEVPRCPECGGTLRPCVVLFEEPVDAMEAAMRMALESDLCLAVGSSLCVYPAATVPEVVKSQGGSLIIVNSDPTPMDRIADLVIREKASMALEAIARELDRRTG